MIDLAYNLLHWVGLIGVVWFGSAIVLYHIAYGLFHHGRVDAIRAIEGMRPWLLLGPFSSILFYSLYKSHKEVNIEMEDE